MCHITEKRFATITYQHVTSPSKTELQISLVNFFQLKKKKKGEINPSSDIKKKHFVALYINPDISHTTIWW
jgi:hypothetical protein